MIIFRIFRDSLIVLLLTTLSLKKGREGIFGQSLEVRVHHLKNNRTNSLEGFLPVPDSNSLYRIKRQLDDESRGLSAASTLSCDFGSSGNLDLCTFFLSEEAHPNVRWKTGSGSTAYWLGGPLTDKTTDDASGKVKNILTNPFPFVSLRDELPFEFLEKS